MWPDGICRVSDTYYTKTIAFEDINYQLNQDEDKNAIFEAWCDFLNYFDSSIHVQLSFLDLAAADDRSFRAVVIPPQDDDFDDIRAEYSGMLQNQLAKGNNGLVKTKYITFGIQAEKSVSRPKLAHDPKRPVVTAAHRKIAEVEDDNVGVESAHAAEITAEDGVHRARASYRVRRTHLKNSSIRETGSKKGTAKPIQSGAHSNPISRRFQRRNIQKQYAAARRGGSAASNTAASVERTARRTARAGARVSAFASRHKKGLLAVLAVFLAGAFFMNTFSSCSVIVGGATEALAATTYPCEDSDMLGAEAAYCGMEQELQEYLDDYQRTHDYDEYHFDLDEIKHDPYVLISYLTAWMGGPWTLDEVQDTLGMIFDRQYILTEDVRSETRCRTETKTGTRQRTDPNTGQTYSEEYEYEARVPYTYTICYVSLENFNLSHLWTRRARHTRHTS